LGSASALQREARKIRHLMTQEEVDVDELLSAVTSVENGFTLTLSNLERAANLVTSFKRTAVDQTSGDVRTFRVLEVIEDTINTLHNRFKPTPIKIQVACPKDLKVKSLPGALEQILTNLLINSLIHGFEEGQRAGQIQIAVQLQDSQLHLEYSDNGKGIASENLPKIFEPFFTTHRAHGGSGLGMYICYNLVTTQLQGTLTVDSVLGQGVVFRVDYPVLVQI
jgi:signal transduction histidine kinase